MQLLYKQTHLSVLLHATQSQQESTDNWIGHHCRILIRKQLFLASVSQLTPSKAHASLGTDDKASEILSTTSWTSVCIVLGCSASSFHGVSSYQWRSDDSWPYTALLEDLIYVNTDSRYGLLESVYWESTAVLN